MSVQRRPAPVLRHPAFEDVLLLAQVDRLAHQEAGLCGIVEGGEIQPRWFDLQSSRTINNDFYR
jgi:hypothetical protein